MLLQGYINETLSIVTEDLISSAGQNPVLDSYRSGIINALRDVLQYDFNLEGEDLK